MVLIEGGRGHSRLLNTGMLVQEVDKRPRNITKKSATQKYQQTFQK